ncbi:MAG: hypothetical protein ACLRWM_05730 [Streptococcus sp.]
MFYGTRKIYQAIITGRAMLITGSGAHMTALGMNGEKFPSGVALAERLYKSAGIVNPENPYDLQDQQTVIWKQKARMN